MSLIRFEDVTKTYPSSQGGVFHLNFDIQRGEFVYLIGSSGAGKSTIINLLTKYIEPDSGKIRLNDLDFAEIFPDEVPYLRRNYGIVSEKMGLMLDRTVFDNVAYPLMIQGFKRRQSKVLVDNILGSVGIKGIAGKKAAFISGGERARVLLARALVTSPPILIADEPTAGLDKENAWDILNLIEHFNHEGVTILMATHQESLVNLSRKRVIWLKNGRISSDEKKGRYRSLYKNFD